MARILLVDDDAAILRAYAKTLEAAGFTVDKAADGAEAAARFKVSRYDVIVSDISMPGMTGLELVRAVREFDLDVPVVLVTGDPSLQTAIKAVEYGAFGYLVKPVPGDELVALVTRANRLHGLAKLKREALSILDEGGKQLGDKASMEARFETALRTMWIAFQPIVSVKQKRIFGYEALLRSAEPALASPGDFLGAAKALDRIADVSRNIRKLVAAAAADAPKGALLFVNLHETDLLDSELFAPGAPLSGVAERVVLELTERAPVHEMRDVATKISSLRRLGYRMAIDDLGAGYAGLTCLTQIQPEVVKIDMSLIRGIDANPTKQSVVRSITSLCGDLKMTVIAEGVETIAERDTLVGLGSDMFQGYIYGKPGRGFPEPIW